MHHISATWWRKWCWDHVDDFTLLDMTGTLCVRVCVHERVCVYFLNLICFLFVQGLLTIIQCRRRWWRELRSMSTCCLWPQGSGSHTSRFELLFSFSSQIQLGTIVLRMNGSLPVSGVQVPLRLRSSWCWILCSGARNILTFPRLISSYFMEWVIMVSRRIHVCF